MRIIKDGHRWRAICEGTNDDTYFRFWEFASTRHDAYCAGGSGARNEVLIYSAELKKIAHKFANCPR